jgi:hypothetical protein
MLVISGIRKSSNNHDANVAYRQGMRLHQKTLRFANKPDAEHPARLTKHNQGSCTASMPAPP